MKPMLSPSLMCTDLLKIREQTQAPSLHADSYHIDIMDGHFTKNITLSPDSVEAVAHVSRIPLDCHLMVMYPDDYITVLVQAGVTFLSSHTKTINTDAFRIPHKIHELGCGTNIVLNPATPLSYTQYYPHLLDKITITSVDPGLAEQASIREILNRIEEARALKSQHGYRYLIEVDGSCNITTFQELCQAGVEVFIVGNSGLFQLDDNLYATWEKTLVQFHGEIDKIQHLRKQLQRRTVIKSAYRQNKQRYPCKMGTSAYSVVPFIKSFTASPYTDMYAVKNEWVQYHIYNIMIATSFHNHL